LLDVQHPEPPRPGSPLFDLPNIHLSAHIAGSMGDEVRRMADMMIEEAIRWLAGQPLRYRVDPAELDVRA
jgi:phosphoglycerate dehydrogenase-like enzyme